MKICPKCNTGNNDTAVICSECMKSLKDVTVENEEISEKFWEREEKRERCRRVFRIAVIPVYYAVYITFYILTVRLERGPAWVLLIPLFFPLFYWLCVEKAEWVFKLEHMLHIDNIDDARPSDWYLMTTKISGYIFLIMGLVMVIMVYCDVKDVPERDGFYVTVGDETYPLFENTELPFELE